MYTLNNSQFACAAFLWPALVAESASEIASAAAREFADLAIEPQPQTTRERQWTTRNCVALELPTVRLRDFSMAGEGIATLLCAPFALHGSTMTDFAPGHSLVAALQAAGMRRVFVTNWRSASLDMRFLSIDNYLADLNVLVDELGSRVNLLGLCQGGWMALIYAARFPDKVARLALAGAPIDLAAGKSKLSELAHDTPISIFRELVDLGGGRILGQHALQFWAPHFPDPEAVRALLQSPHAIGSTAFRRLESRFRDCVDARFARNLLSASRRRSIRAQPPCRRPFRGAQPQGRSFRAALPAVPARRTRRRCRGARADICDGASGRSTVLDREGRGAVRTSRLVHGQGDSRPDLAGYRALAVALTPSFAASCRDVCRRSHIPQRRTNHTFTK